MPEDIQTKIFVELAEIRTSTQKTEEHLKQLNSKVVKNQDAINQNRVDMAQVFTKFTSVLEKQNDSKFEEQSLTNDLKELRQKVSALENWRWYIIGIGALAVFLAPILTGFVLKYI